MPIHWQCPGSPQCMKVYLYAAGLKAHMAACKQAQKRKVRHKRDEIETMISIILFVEDQKKGHVMLCRQHVDIYDRTPEIFKKRM